MRCISSLYCWFNVHLVLFEQSTTRKSAIGIFLLRSAEVTRKLLLPLRGCCWPPSTTFWRRTSLTTLSLTTRQMFLRLTVLLRWRKQFLSCNGKGILLRPVLPNSIYVIAPLRGLAFLRPFFRDAYGRLFQTFYLQLCVIKKAPCLYITVSDHLHITDKVLRIRYSLFQQAVYHFSQLKGSMGENKSFSPHSRKTVHFSLVYL